MFKDYYSILEIPVNATEEQIKYAYKEQAKKWHPDRNPDFDTTERMQDVNEAFLILSDIEARRLYDEEYILFLRTSKQDKDSDIKEDSYSDFSINNDLLRTWIIKAQKQASDLVKETLSEIKDLSVEGAKASGNKMIQLIIGFVAVGVIFSIIISISQKSNETKTSQYTYPPNTPPATTSLTPEKKLPEKEQEKWIDKSFRDFSFKIPSSLKQRTANEYQILFYPDDETIAISINIGAIPDGYNKNIAIRDLINDIASFANESTQEKRLNFSDYQLYNYGFSHLGNIEALRIEQYSTQISGKNIKTKDDTYFVTRNGYFMSISFVYSEAHKKEVGKIVESFIFSADNKQNINISSLKKRFIGKHLFSCHFIGYEKSYGKVSIEEKDNIIYLTGEQRKGEKWLYIEGSIEIVSIQEFNFTGTIRVYNPEEYDAREKGKSPNCEWTGTTIFKTVFDDGVYWRNRKNCCYSFTGDMDIYFNEKGTRY